MYSINDFKGINQKIKSQNKIEDKFEYREETLMRVLYTTINSTLYPYIIQVLDEYEYEGSPMYSTYGIDRETLLQMVDRVIEISKERIWQVEEINEREGLNSTRLWDEYGLLRATIEAMLLSDIFMIRRPTYFEEYFKPTPF